MSALIGFSGVEKTEENIARFFDDFKDDNRPITGLNVLDEYASLNALFEKMPEELAENEKKWENYPTYLRMKHAKQIINASYMIERWAKALKEQDTRRLIGIWEYIRLMIDNNLNSGLYCECELLIKGSNLDAILNVYPEGYPYDEEYDEFIDYLRIRDYLLQLTEHKGSLNINFRKAEDYKLIKQLVLGSTSEGEIHVDTGKKSRRNNLIVPIIYGMSHEDSNDVEFIYAR